MSAKPAAVSAHAREPDPGRGTRDSVMPTVRTRQICGGFEPSAAEFRVGAGRYRGWGLVAARPGKISEDPDCENRKPRTGSGDLCVTSWVNALPVCVCVETSAVPTGLNPISDSPRAYALG